MVEGGKVHFANQLRGLAAVAVVWHHLGYQYSNGSKFAAAYVGLAPPPSISELPWWTTMTSLLLRLGTEHQQWDFGAFGVALFFLVSGFVIPFSIQRLSRAQFFVARLIRIYSVYIPGLLLLALFSIQIAGYLGEPSSASIPLRHWIHQGTLTFDVFATPVIDSVSWTLLIELKFYLLCILCAGSIRAGAIGGFLTLPLVTLLSAYLIKSGLAQSALSGAGFPSFAWVLQQVTSQMAFVCFLLIGYLFWLTWKQKLTGYTFVLVTTCFWGTELATLHLLGVDASAITNIAISQVMALVVFGGAFYLRHHIGSFFLFDRLSDVSYPLYCTHLLAGYCVLVAGSRIGLPQGLTLIAALASCLALAYALHWLVEQPSQVLGKRAVSLLKREAVNAD